MAEGTDVDRWVLPGDLARSLDASNRARGTDGGRTVRTARDWTVDTLVFVACLVMWALEAFGISASTGVAAWLLPLDLVGGVVMCLAIWRRRENPVVVGLAAAVIGAFSNSASLALLVGFFSLALHRGWRWGYGVALLAQVLALPHLLAYRPPGVAGSLSWIVIVTLVVLLVTTAGVMVRARRQLVRVLEQRALDARLDRTRRVGAARTAERERIAREMHDVLAHRLSLLAVHAGALEYRIASAPSDSVPPEVAASVAVIRENAHLSLEELRDVLHVLRAGDTSDPSDTGDPDGTDAAPDAGRRPPSPTLASVPALVDEAREAGQVVTVAMAGTDLVPVPAALQRTVFRVVQEGMTNARKHAPGSAVAVLVQVRLGGTARGDGTLEVVVSNPVVPGVTAAEMPGARRGHVGLAERAVHHGGRLTHTVEHGRYVLTATLPLPRGGMSVADTDADAEAEADTDATTAAR